MNAFSSPLLDSMRETCVLLNKTVTRDKTGGYVTQYTRGAEFDAVIAENTSVEAAIAGINTEKEMVGVTVANGVPLEYHSVFMRVGTGKTYRVRTSDVLKAPSISALGSKVVQCEEFEITEEST